jgi:hypothetical protein
MARGVLIGSMDMALALSDEAGKTQRGSPLSPRSDQA